MAEIKAKANSFCRNRKAFMFTLDAMLATMILVGGLLMISQHLLTERPKENLEYLTTDTLSVLYELKMSDINTINSSFYSYLLGSSFTNQNFSVMEQIGTYWAVNDTVLALNLSNFVMANLFPRNMGFNLSMETDVVFNQSLTYDNYSMLVVGQRMITGITQGSPLTGSTSSAYLQRISDKRTSSFAYFGGFVGQGNITVRLDDLPSDITTTGNVREMFLEGEFDSDFNLLINRGHCRFVNVNNAEVQRFNATNCSSMLQSGDNTVGLNFTEGITNSSISGGLLGVKYVTTEFGTFESEGYKRTYLPDIKGIINLYDGFMVPGTLLSLNISLHYWIADNVTLPLYLDIGNTNVLSLNVTGEQSYNLTGAYLDAYLNYTNNPAPMSNTTIPLRLGFYEGNTTNATGNLTDVYLLTSKYNLMSTNDVIINSTANTTRMAEARVVDNLFVDIVLNATGNRIGLVSFGDNGVNSNIDASLTTNALTLHSIIDSYTAGSGNNQRMLCDAMKKAKDALIASSGRKRVIMLMTDGDPKKPSGNTQRCVGNPTTDRSLIWSDVVRQACNFTDYSGNGNPSNITFYTVAFGQEAANDPAIVANLTKIANCTGGKFALGTNASALENIYRQFATEIAASSIVYTFQRATSASSVESNLYGDSYIDFTYTPSTTVEQQNQIPLTFQTDQFGTCAPTVNIPEGVTVVDAHIVSYSADYWTKYLVADGAVVYNLSTYGVNFTNLGDPFQILVPPNILTPGDHTLSIALGANSSSNFPCSFNDSLIYTGLVSTTTNRTDVRPGSNGCIWTVESEDNEFQDITVPSEYAGSNLCNYTNASISYNSDDAYDLAAYQLLSQLDPDRDGRVTVNFQDEDLDIQITTVSNVPYLWGPTLVKVRVWQ